MTQLLCPRFLPILMAIALAGLAVPGPVRAAQPPPKALRVLLITGGCCHDYTAQKDILKKGLEARAHVVVDQVHSDNRSANPRPLTSPQPTSPPSWPQTTPAASCSSSPPATPTSMSLPP